MNGTSLADRIATAYPGNALHHLTPATSTHDLILPAVHELVAKTPDLFRLEEVGRSIEGRSINAVECGTGSRRVLLWTQMHGDEPTATLAIVDLLHLIACERSEAWVKSLLDAVTVRCLVMLNPDGAARRRRVNAVQIDLNRDADNLLTPEAQLLRGQHRLFRPEFAFNLHDQGPRSVGETLQPAAMSLLAPPMDGAGTVDQVRKRAIRLAAYIAGHATRFAPGSITRYDDVWEPRAFGDAMQSWGTSTVLIESGHVVGDPEKRTIRKLNTIVLGCALAAIGDGSFEQADEAHYLSLPPNGDRVFDVVVRGVEMRHSSGWSGKVAIGLIFEDASARFGGGTLQDAVVKQVGDLSRFRGLQELDGTDWVVNPEEVAIGGRLVKR